MALPIVAIIGRPNVGKSSLFNALAGKMISIVEPTAGVTRDRISTILEKNDRYFELVDTGGYGVVDSQKLSPQIEKQIITAIESADLVLFTVDIRDGIVPLDKKIAQLLRKKNLSVLGVANKADNAKMFPSAGEFTRLGFGEFICVSATNNLNKAVLLDKIFEKVEHLDISKPPEPIMKLAIVGKCNTGKSTLVNAITGTERVIVSEIPGTTRDAVDVRFEKDGKTIIIIDTAGLRKKKSLQKSDIDFYSYVRAAHSVKRADVVLFMMDATVPTSQVDKKLSQTIAQEYKACILVVNKWDLAKDQASTSDYEDYLTKTMPVLRHAPIIFTTATTGKNVQAVLDMAAQLFKQATTRISTSKLNAAFDAIKEERPGGIASNKGGKRPKIYYATQIEVNPVTIMLSVNRPELFEENYLRFIVGRLRNLLPISEVPIRLLARPHRKEPE